MDPSWALTFGKNLGHLGVKMNTIKLLSLLLLEKTSIILLWPTPDDFTCQRESSRLERVNETRLVLILLKTQQLVVLVKLLSVGHNTCPFTMSYSLSN